MASKFHGRTHGSCVLLHLPILSLTWSPLVHSDVNMWLPRFALPCACMFAAVVYDGVPVSTSARTKLQAII